MNIIEAARAMRDGKKVRMSSYRVDEWVLYERDNVAMLTGTEGPEEAWMFISDLLADDWEVVDEQNV